MGFANFLTFVKKIWQWSLAGFQVGLMNRRKRNCPFYDFLRFAPVPSATKKLFLKKKSFGFSKRLFSLRVLETCSVRLLEILNSALEYRLVLVSVNILRNIIRQSLRVSHLTKHTSIRRNYTLNRAHRSLQSKTIKAFQVRTLIQSHKKSTRNLKRL